MGDLGRDCMGIVGRDGGMMGTGRAECVCCSFWFLGDGLEVLSVKEGGWQGRMCVYILLRKIQRNLTECYYATSFSDSHLLA